MENSKQIEERAAAWLMKRDSGDWANEDERALQQWLDASTAHTVAYIRLETVWSQARRLKALGAGRERGVVPPPKAWQLSPFFEPRQSAAISDNAAAGRAAAMTSSPASGSFKRWRALAASVVLSIAAGLTWHLWLNGPDYSTPIGGTSSVPMKDGSIVTLNTDSAIRIAVTDTQRRVDLERGEAFFDVAGDPNRPFVVAAGNKRVIAVGTKFSVRRIDDDLRVLVTEGKVRFEDDSMYEASEAAAGGAERVSGEPHSTEKSADESEVRAMLFSAGTIARAGDAGVLVQEKALGEVEEHLTWRSGFVTFREVPLADAVSEMNRYNTQKIIIQDPRVAAIPISGKFRATNFEAFVRLLEGGFPIRARYEDDRIILIDRNASTGSAANKQ